MATTTPLNGWPVPTSTDYVKDGASAIESLGDAIDTSVGSGLLAWTSYTPNFTGLSLTGATVEFAYCLIGKTVHLRGSVTFGTASPVTGSITFSPPIASDSGSVDKVVGHALFIDAGTAAYPGVIRNTTTVLFTINPINAAGTYATAVPTAAAVPFTWVSGDAFHVTATYERS